MSTATDSLSQDCLLTDSKIRSKQRWKILKEALLGRRSELTSQSTVSVRRFSSFGLLKTSLLSSSEDADWYEYTCPTVQGFRMTIRHLPGVVKPETLLGFNNTGNVCVWPAEEILAHYCLGNIHLFRGKSVCELGGGMTCLAGIAIALESEASHVEVSDGNEDSVKNLQYIIDRYKNGDTAGFGNTQIHSRLIRWGDEPVDADLTKKFDYILCADCLFFEDGRQALVDTIYQLLKPQGEAVIFAPARGKTFDIFVELAKKKFEVSVEENYNAMVWDIHCKMKEKGLEEYDPNIHYPMYLSLKKIMPPEQSL